MDNLVGSNPAFLNSICSGRENGIPAMCLAIEFDSSNLSHCARGAYVSGQLFGSGTGSHMKSFLSTICTIKKVVGTTLVPLN